VSHGALRYLPPGSVDPDDAGEVRPSPPTSTPPVVTLPARVEAPPADDWSRWVAPDGPELHLADGTALATPPGPCPCGGTGWGAVLRVEGSAEDAIDDYAAQLGVDDPEIREGAGEGDVLIADLGLVPGGITQLRAVTDERGTWLLVATGLG
jgi:hypothetical protein